MLSRCVIKVGWKKELELCLSLLAGSAQEGMPAIPFDLDVLMLEERGLLVHGPAYHSPNHSRQKSRWYGSNISAYGVILETPIMQEHLR